MGSARCLWWSPRALSPSRRYLNLKLDPSQRPGPGNLRCCQRPGLGYLRILPSAWRLFGPSMSPRWLTHDSSISSLWFHRFLHLFLFWVRQYQIIPFLLWPQGFLFWPHQSLIQGARLDCICLGLPPEPSQLHDRCRGRPPELFQAQLPPQTPSARPVLVLPVLLLFRTIWDPVLGGGILSRFRFGCGVRGFLSSVGGVSLLLVSRLSFNVKESGIRKMYLSSFFLT